MRNFAIAYVFDSRKIIFCQAVCFSVLDVSPMTSLTEHGYS